MKKIIKIFALLLFTNGVFAQYFQGTFEKDPAFATNKKLVFKMKPVGNLTTNISYMEFSFRYATASTPSFTAGSIVSNTSSFPTLNIQRLADYTESGYTYIKYVHNTSTIPSFTYVNGTEYTIFTIVLSGSGTIPQLEMSSELVAGNYVFGVVDGGGNFIDPGAANQLYGTGFNISGGIHLLPLTSLVLPVKFTEFTAVKKANNGLLTWSVENENAETKLYEVERSFNGANFNTIATLDPKNNGSSINTYNLTDANIDGLKANGIIYYRIKQIDFSGRVTFSDIRKLYVDDKQILIAAYPNPVQTTTTLKIELAKEGIAQVMILDASGRQVQQLQVQCAKGTNTKTIDMSALADGIYQIAVKAKDELKTIRVIKAR